MTENNQPEDNHDGIVAIALVITGLMAIAMGLFFVMGVLHLIHSA